jgi:hypothetical protein
MVTFITVSLPPRDARTAAESRTTVDGDQNTVDYDGQAGASPEFDFALQAAPPITQNVAQWG